MKQRRPRRLLNSLVILLVLAIPLLFPQPAPAQNVTPIASSFSFPMDPPSYGIMDEDINRTGYGVANKNGVSSEDSTCWTPQVPKNQLLHAGEDWYKIPDYPNTTGAVVKAVANGKVLYWNNNFPGEVLIIEHILPDGFNRVYSLYGHIRDVPNSLKPSFFNQDPIVLRGQTVGFVLASTFHNDPNRVDSHVHWELRSKYDMSDVCGAFPYPSGPGYTQPTRYPDTYEYINPSRFVESSQVTNQVRIFTLTHFRGSMEVLSAPFSVNLMQAFNGKFNDKLQSIAVPPGWNVRVYENSDKSGGKRLLSQNDYNLVGAYLDNGVSAWDHVSYIELETSTNNPPPPGPSLPPASDGIDVVDISHHEVSPGEVFRPSVTIRRTTGQLDTSAYLHAVPEDNSNRFGAWPTQGVHHYVASGNNYTFSSPEHQLFAMTAPQQTGTYQSVWRMHVNGQDVGPNIVIPITVRTVSEPAPIAYWNADYYSSKDLSGSVAHHTTISDQYLFRSWGIGSPHASVPVDNWSARFVRIINFPGGDYHFHCQHDDGCRLYIDGQEKLNAWWDSSFDGHDWTGPLSAGYHEVKVEYYDQGGEARVDMWWQGPGFLPRFPSCEPDQWCADYWGNKTLSGFPPLTQSEGSVSLNAGWGNGGPGYNLPADNFSARFTRTVSFACGVYRFHTVADDGVRVYIDGVLALNEWHDQSADFFDFDTSLNAGDHAIKVEYFETAGNTAMQLSWTQILACAPYSGNLTVESGQTLYANTIQTAVNAASTTVNVGSSTGFEIGDTVLFHQTQGTANVGRWEKNEITGIDGTSWTLASALTNTYSSTGGGHAQVIKVPHYDSVNVQSGGTLTALPWNGTTGGILVFESDGTITINGTVTMSAKGYRGGTTPSSSGREGQQGEGYLAPGSNVWDNRPANGSGGGGGSRTSQSSLSTGGGGGGGHATVGAGGWNMNGSGLFGLGGNAVGSPDLSTIFFGGGGGQGGNANGYYGGNGGGAILIFGDQVSINGSLVSDGGHQGTNSVSNQDGNGGGGAGGSILLRANTLTIGANKVTTLGDGGSGGTVGPSGSSSVGRIRVEYCNTLSGSTNPAASTAQTCSTPTPTPIPPTNTPVPPTNTPTPAPSTATLSPIEDTFVQAANPTQVWGSDPYLNIDAEPSEVGYLKFDLTGLNGVTVSSAKLRIYVANASGNSQQIRETSNSWSESTLNWNNRPSLGGTVVGTINSGGTTGVWKETDITASVQAHVGGTYSIGIDTTGTDGLGFPSSENSNAPQLVVNYGGGSPPPTNTPVPGNTNLALNGDTGESSHDADLVASNAVDGNMNTRWGSAEGHDPEWVGVDLGASHTIGRVKIYWEVAHAVNYQVQVSNDTVNWTTIASVTGSDGELDDLTVSGTGRYIRVFGTSRSTPWGYSIWEFEVYAGGGSPPPTSTPAPPTNTPTPPPATATPTPVSGGVELLDEPWLLEGEDGSAELYQGLDANALQGKTHVRITYNLHGLSALGGDASAIIFDQNGWQFISLSDYGQNGYNGVQTVTIPLSDFGDLDPNSDVGTLHTRFWHEGVYTVDITSIVAITQ